MQFISISITLLKPVSIIQAPDISSFIRILPMTFFISGDFRANAAMSSILKLDRL